MKRKVFVDRSIDQQRESYVANFLVSFMHLKETFRSFCFNSFLLTSLIPTNLEFHEAFLSDFFILFSFWLLQDYHRFHSPVSGTIDKFVKIPGCLYKVCIYITKGLFFLVFVIISFVCYCPLTSISFFFAG
jgi:hypothetical protein